MNDKIYEARKKQAKLQSTPEIEKADNNFIAAIALCVLLSIVCFTKCSIQLKKQSYANTNVQPVLQK